MTQDLFRTEIGVEIEDGPSILASSGLPGLDIYTSAALPGSFCTDTTSGKVYKKITVGSGTDKWELSIGQSDLNAAVGSQQWRDPVVVRDDTSYGNLAAAEAAVNTGLINGHGIATGNRILFTNITGQPKNVFIVNGTIGSGATLVQDTKILAEGDVLSILNGTYDNEQHYFDGTNWNNTGSDASAELAAIRTFIGKNAAGVEVPVYSSTTYATGSLENAIGALDAAVTSNDTDITNIQNANTAIQTEVDAIETSAGPAISNTGTWVGYSGTNYINSATSLSNADVLLDTAAGAIQTELDNVETALGAAISIAGLYVAHSSTNYIDGNANITEDLLDLDAQILIVNNSNVSRLGDTMEPGANLVFVSGGEVLGLPAAPSGPTSAVSKAYVDSLTSGLVWVNPVWFVDVCSDQFTTAITKDLQTPANNTSPYLTALEDSDILIVGGGSNLTWTAVGTTGHSATLTNLNPGDIVRWKADTDNSGADPVWINLGHISDNSKIGSDQVNGRGVAKSRVGLDIATGRSPSGTFTGFDNAIMSLVVADFDGDSSTTEYDSLWGVDKVGITGKQEVNTITTVAKTSITNGDYFDLYAAVFGPNVTGSTLISPTNAADGGTKFYVWYDVTGSATDPNPAGYAEGIKVDIQSAVTAANVATATITAINAHRPQQSGTHTGKSVLWAAADGTVTNEVVITDLHMGRTHAAADGTATTGFTFARTTTGNFSTPKDGTATFVSNQASSNFGNQFTFTGGNWVMFGGSAAIVAGIGLSQTGNIFNVNMGAGIVELQGDEVAVDIRTNSGLWLTTDGVTSTTASAGELAVNLDGTSLTMGANGIRVNATILQEIDAIETSMGPVIDANGTYVAHSGTNYINLNTTVTQDLLDLDAQIAVNAGNITTVNTNIGNLQTEIDAIETSMGSVIGANGTYVPFTTTNYINNNANVAEDLTNLDTQIKVNQDAITSLASTNGDEANIRSFIGKGAAGVETPVYSSATVVTQNADLETAIGELDAAFLNTSVQAQAAGVTTETTLDSVVVDNVKVAKWILHMQQGNKVTVVEILATHDGQPTTDATDADWTTYAKLKINGNITGSRPRVRVSGIAGAQIMELRVKANAATNMTSVRRVIV